MFADPATIIQQIAIAIIPLIFAITLHEAAHGYVASKLGDTTALMLGRVSLNPSRHIDPIGTILIPMILLATGGFIFGWAKPVPVNRHNLNHPNRDMALVALAGPLANLVMALFWALITKLIFNINFGASAPWLQSTAIFLKLSAVFGIKINVVLMVLNLLPIPPLDGSRVVSSLLPAKTAIWYESIEPFGIWILLALIFLKILPIIINPMIISVLQSIASLFTL